MDWGSCWLCVSGRWPCQHHWALWARLHSGYAHIYTHTLTHCCFHLYITVCMASVTRKRFHIWIQWHSHISIYGLTHMPTFLYMTLWLSPHFQISLTRWHAHISIHGLNDKLTFPYMDFVIYPCFYIWTHWHSRISIYGLKVKPRFPYMDLVTCPPKFPYMALVIQTVVDQIKIWFLKPLYKSISMPILVMF